METTTLLAVNRVLNDYLAEPAWGSEHPDDEIRRCMRLREVVLLASTLLVQPNSPSQSCWDSDDSLTRKAWRLCNSCHTQMLELIASEDVLYLEQGQGAFTKMLESSGFNTD